MISKELIKTVTGEEPDYIELVKGSKWENNIKQTVRLNYKDEKEPIDINIYELAHKCKKWAVKEITKKFPYSPYIKTETIYPRGENKIYYFCELQSELIYIDEVNNTYFKRFVAETEPEAVFKAVEWIYKQKENKNEK